MFLRYKVVRKLGSKSNINNSHCIKQSYDSYIVLHENNNCNSIYLSFNFNNYYSLSNAIDVVYVKSSETTSVLKYASHTK